MDNRNNEYSQCLSPCGFEPDVVPVAYIAGPMRGRPLNNFPAFFDAAIRLRASGWTIENPAEYDMAAGVDPSGAEEDWPITVKQMLRTDFRIILERVNAIIMLPGWNESKGACMELTVATAIGLPVFELLEDWEVPGGWDLFLIHPEYEGTSFNVQGSAAAGGAQ